MTKFEFAEKFNALSNEDKQKVIYALELLEQDREFDFIDGEIVLK